MTHGSLFSGIGGFDLAAEWMGWTNIFHCEIEEFPRTILNHYWPNAISYEDITKTDFTIHRGQIDILTGGFPCQPYSQAGKRLGKDDERHLWPEMLRAITEIAPRWVVGENVSGIINWNGGMVFEEVQADLESEGYTVQPVVLPAAAVGAPHRRDRVWFVAYSSSIRRGGGGISSGSDSPEREPVGAQIGHDGDGVRRKASGCGSTAPNTDRIRLPQERAGVEAAGFTRDGVRRYFADPNRIQRSERWLQKTRSEETERHPGACYAFRYRRGAWDNFPTQSPVCSRDDGLSTELDGITFPKWRRESIKAYGNAIVPQVAMQIFKAIHKYETKHILT